MQHPNHIIPEQVVKTIRTYTLQAEQEKSLPAPVLDLIYSQQWFQALVPAAAGGKELSLPDAVRLFEALAWADANVGWCVNLGAGANMFAGYFDADTAHTIFHSPETCCAGSGAISGTAVKTAGGYKLSGRWKYASGANHATHFTANAWLWEEDGKAIHEDGVLVFRSFIIPAAQITNCRNWDAIGLCATSSNDFEAHEVFVPERHTFTLLKPSAFANGPVYQFPFAIMAVINMTCMITGIAQHFLDEYEALATIKKPLHSDMFLQDNPVATQIHNRAATDFHTARAAMYEQLDKVWHIYGTGGEADEAALQQLKSRSNTASDAARRLINDLFPLCGMNNVAPQSALNKIWRDAAVASQHYLLSPLQTQNQQP